MTDSGQQQQEQRDIQPADGSTPSGVLGFSKRTKIIAVLVAVLATVLAPAVLAFQSTVEFGSVTAAVQNSTPAGDRLGVQGKLVPGSYVQSVDGLSAVFKLRDEVPDSPHLTVYYDGEIGQLFFNEHSEIFLEGSKQSDGTLVADRLNVKCPSKYQTEEEALRSETT